MGNILISGASSGIGAALARCYAAPQTELILWGRDEARLEAVAADCRARGAAVTTHAFDLVDTAALTAALAAAGPVDIAYFNAGLGGSLPREAVAQEPGHAARMAAVNFTAPVIGANVMAEQMAARGGGRIVLVGSVAALFPLPMAPVYSGSKAGLHVFAEALDTRLRRRGIRVSLVAPGFIDTPMSQGLKEPRPFLITAERCAQIVKARVARGDRRIVVPWPFAVIAFLARFLPKALVRAVLSKV
jgi:short-subunit dehydrogenase